MNERPLDRAIDELIPLGCLALYLVAEVSQVGEPVKALGLPSPWFATTGLSVLCIVIGLGRGTVRLRWSPIFGAVGLYVWTRAVSSVLAVDPTVTVELFTQLLKDVLTVAIVTTLAMSCGTRLWRVAVPVVGAIAFLTSLAALQQWVIGTGNDLYGLSTLKNYVDIGSVTMRFQGPLDDPNFWGRVLVAVVPFALALVVGWVGWKRLLAVGATGSILIGVFLTQSRGAFLSAGAAVVAFAVLAGPRVRRYLLLVPVVAALLLVNPWTGPRLATLADLQHADVEDVTDLSLVYRETAQSAGLAMFADHELVGVGPGNFRPLTPEYIREGVASLPPTATLGEIAPHNTYLEMAAEGGLLGLAAYLVMVGAGVACGSLGLRRANRAPGSTSDIVMFRLFAAASVASLLAWSFASVWLHVNQFRTLLIVLSLAAATLPIARALPEEPPPPRLRGLVRVTEDVISVAVATLASALLFAVLPGGEVTTAATTQSAVLVQTDSAARFPYMQQYISRGYLTRRGIAEVTAQRSVTDSVKLQLAAEGYPGAADVTFEARARRYLMVIELTAGSADPATAQRAAVLWGDAAANAVAALEQPFRLATFGPVTTAEVVPSNRLLDLAIVALPLAVVLWRVRRTLRRRGRFIRDYDSYTNLLRQVHGIPEPVVAPPVDARTVDA